jgi:hypothetical protein
LYNTRDKNNQLKQMPKTKPSLLEPEMVTPENAAPRWNFNPSKKHIPWIIIAVVILAACIFAFQQHRTAKIAQQQLEELKKNPSQATEQETRALLDKIGQLVELPKEQPTVATVTDLAPLKDQPFFANAQVGDKVLIYSQTKKAILYRPSTNKVIEIAPVDLEAPATNASINGNKNVNTTNSNKNNPAAQDNK